MTPTSQTGCHPEDSQTTRRYPSIQDSFTIFSVLQVFFFHTASMMVGQIGYTLTPRTLKCLSRVEKEVSLSLHKISGYFQPLLYSFILLFICCEFLHFEAFIPPSGRSRGTYIGSTTYIQSSRYFYFKTRILSKKMLSSSFQRGGSQKRWIERGELLFTLQVEVLVHAPSRHSWYNIGIFLRLS